MSGQPISQAEHQPSVHNTNGVRKNHAIVTADIPIKVAKIIIYFDIFLINTQINYQILSKEIFQDRQSMQLLGKCMVFFSTMLFGL